MLTKGRLIQLVIMLAVLVFLFIWRTLDEDLQTESLQEVDNKQQTELIASQQQLPTEMEDLCQFKQACLFKTLYGNFYLGVDEKSIQPEQWINLTLQSELKDWQVKQAKIVGKSMFMGKIPIMFKSSSENIKKAKTMVGACTEKDMIWRFDIVVEVQGQPLNLYYDFAVAH